MPAARPPAYRHPAARQAWAGRAHRGGGGRRQRPPGLPAQQPAVHRTSRLDGVRHGEAAARRGEPRWPSPSVTQHTANPISRTVRDGHTETLPLGSSWKQTPLNTPRRRAGSLPQCSRCQGRAHVQGVGVPTIRNGSMRSWTASHATSPSPGCLEHQRGVPDQLTASLNALQRSTNSTISPLLLHFCFCLLVVVFFAFFAVLHFESPSPGLCHSECPTSRIPHWVHWCVGPGGEGQ